MELKLNVGLISVILLVVKLFFIPTMPWWVVLLPLAPIALFLVVWTVGMVVALIGFAICWIFK